MRAEEADFFILDKTFVEEFRDLDAVVQLSDTVIFRPFIVLEYNDILYFLVPNGKMDCR